VGYRLLLERRRLRVPTNVLPLRIALFTDRPLRELSTLLAEAFVVVRLNLDGIPIPFEMETLRAFVPALPRRTDPPFGLRPAELDPDRLIPMELVGFGSLLRLRAICTSYC
jgi:hypothetical protein